MARYIDVDKMIQQLEKSIEFQEKYASFREVKQTKLFIESLKNEPTADVVEVVRCEKCVDYLYDTPYCKKKNIGYCDRDGAIKQKNHFCSYGERKENND